MRHSLVVTLCFFSWAISASADEQLECRPVGGGYALTRASDGKALGRAIPEAAQCEEARATARENVACVPKEGGGKGWMTIHVNRLHWVGRYPISAADCFEAVRNAADDVVCSHTGLTLDGGRPGFKPTYVELANDNGFLGSSAWLDYCKVASRNAHDGKVCANGNGGTGGHRQWYRHVTKTKQLAQPTVTGSVDDCSSHSFETEKAPGSGYVDMIPPAEAQKYRDLLPYLDNAAIDEAMRSPHTMWYDGKGMVAGYQDSMGDPVGFRPNTIENILIDLAVPGGWNRLFQDRGRFNFPFATGGADLSKNFLKVNFWAPPRQNGQVVPVAYWRLNFTRWRWLFPAGTRLGEVMFIRYPDGELRVFEVRVRTRELDKWHNDVFRPFHTAPELADSIKMIRPAWNESSTLRQVIAKLMDSNTLTPRTLSTQYFKGTFTKVDGHVDEIPDFGDDSLAKDLLQYTSFRTVGDTPWKTSGGKIAYAAGTRSASSIVPSQYDGGLLPSTNESCLRCHKDAGRQIENFHKDLVAYGELWGEDETFSWHPFETSAFVDAKGNVKNFNNDNRRARTDFVAAGLIVNQAPAAQPSHLYKALARDWLYKPIR